MAALHRQRHVDLVEVHHRVAEVRVAVVYADGPARLAGRNPGSAFNAEAAAVAVEVIAARRGKAHQQGVAIAHDGLEAERLLFRQRLGGTVHAAADGCRARCTALQGAAQRRQAVATRRGGGGRWQVHCDGAGVGRVAHADIGATLVAHPQLQLLRTRRGPALEHAGHLLAIGLDLAKELVHMGNAIRPARLAGIEALGAGAHAVAVQVVAIGDVEADFDPAAVGGLGAEAEGLFDRQQVVRINAGGLRRAAQQGGGEQQHAQPAKQHHAGWSPLVSLAIHSR